MSLAASQKSSPRDDTEAPRCQLVVNYIPDAATEEELRELFGAYGKVTAVRLIIDKPSGRRKGYGFVVFAVEAEAAAAAEGLRGHAMYGKRLKITIAEAQRIVGKDGGALRDPTVANRLGPVPMPMPVSVASPVPVMPPQSVMSQVPLMPAPVNTAFVPAPMPPPPMAPLPGAPMPVAPMAGALMPPQMAPAMFPSHMAPVQMVAAPMATVPAPPLGAYPVMPHPQTMMAHRVVPAMPPQGTPATAPTMMIPAVAPYPTAMPPPAPGMVVAPPTPLLAQANCAAPYPQRSIPPADVMV